MERVGIKFALSQLAMALNIVMVLLKKKFDGLTKSYYGSFINDVM